MKVQCDHNKKKTDFYKNLQLVYKIVLNFTSANQTLQISA